MIKRDLTNIYLADFNLLTETLYMCWIKAFDTETFQLNNSLLKELIVSYGFYNYKHTATKETFTNLTDNFRFKHLTWVNQFLDQINQDTFTNYVELYKQVICEIETNLFVLKNKSAQLAYANVLLRDFDKSYIHKMNFEEFEIEKQCKETFEVIIDCRTSIENPSNNLTNYDLSIRLINHLDFIDKLIELFLCFEIDIIALANTHNRNLYLFESKINKYSSNQDWGSTSIGTAYIHLPENKDLRNEVFPKFNSPPIG